MKKEQTGPVSRNVLAEKPKALHTFEGFSRGQILYCDLAEV
jgi:hypothetical protein